MITKKDCDDIKMCISSECYKMNSELWKWTISFKMQSQENDLQIIQLIKWIFSYTTFPPSTILQTTSCSSTCSEPESQPGAVTCGQQSSQHSAAMFLHPPIKHLEI